MTGRILLAYFSRAGENYYYGSRRDLTAGNTEVLAKMISELIACDVVRIEAADPYPESYEATVARNVAEQDADARPAIARSPRGRPHARRLPDLPGTVRSARIASGRMT